MKKYGGRSCEPSLQDLNLRVMAQEISIVIGANASGKSTLLNILSEKFRQTGGSVLYNSFKSTKYNSFYRQQLSFCR